MADNPVIGHAKCHDCGGRVEVKAFKGGSGNCYYFCGNLRDDGEFCHGHARWGGAASRKMKAASAVASRKPVNDNEATEKETADVRTSERSEERPRNFLGL